MGVEGAARTPAPATKNYTPHLPLFEEVAGFSAPRSAMRRPRPGDESLLIDPNSEPGKYELVRDFHSFPSHDHLLSLTACPSLSLFYLHHPDLHILLFPLPAVHMHVESEVVNKNGAIT